MQSAVTVRLVGSTLAEPGARRYSWTTAAALYRKLSCNLQAIAVTTSRRSAGAPYIPIAAESYLPGFEVTPGFGIVGPAAMPREVVDRLNREINTALKVADMLEAVRRPRLRRRPGHAGTVRCRDPQGYRVVVPRGTESRDQGGTLDSH